MGKSRHDIEDNIHNIWDFTKKYSTTFMIIFGIVIVTVLTSAVVAISAHIDYMNQQIFENINEYNEIDYEHLCRITECTKIYAVENTFVKKKYLVEVKFQPLDFKQIYGDIYYKDGEVLFYSDVTGAYFEKNYNSFLIDIIYGMTKVYGFFAIIFGVLLYKTYKRERIELMLQNIGNEAILANKSMVMITENVHHELNTPIEVIENKISRVEDTLSAYITAENERWREHLNVRKLPEEKREFNKKIIKMHKDFEFIHTAIEQIHGVLAKMKNFKTLRYSNGNKNIFNIIEGAFRIISISNTDFKFEIDKGYKEYVMEKEGLKNTDLLNILINHIKNSLEANSTFIKVLPPVYKNGMIELLLRDDGGGIDEKLQHDIFKPNLSSKQIGSSIRGNGMHLNKHIINEFGGDIKIAKTSNEGTDILISFGVIKVEENKK